MTEDKAARQTVNILIVGQSGRLQYEALLFAASLNAIPQTRPLRLYVAEPQPGPLWQNDPRIKDDTVRQMLTDLGATILPFAPRHFGQPYPYGNKIEALFALPPNQPFVFFDTDTLILDDLARVPFDFDRPGASLRREGTWPKPDLYGPGYGAIWKSLYDRFGLDFDSSLDPDQPDGVWRRYLYFNAGFFFFRCPRAFGDLFLRYALDIRDAPPPELTGQSLDPWLDQVALPLVIHALGGGRDALPPGLLDGSVTCHYRTLPLLYAREDDHVVDRLEALAQNDTLRAVLAGHAPFQRFVLDGWGTRTRALFDRQNLPRREQAIRNQLRREGLWMR
ncbi:hypothetical protein VK792_01555 [Mesobacterium sp. TK19101]|uniref:Uncharacterized protein n=1 Tax=Mesobacterium hydrothermale TaxID=3111907 RepID=A0ABU6HER7_9RHOB|nr:hypothetical protein [Mesobacterium sp. TK19101]MEC3859958.1 hypothetical protein [Mesobacterium sp. TK19101]